MKSLMISTILTLSLTTFGLSYADEQFEIKNDLYYSHVNGPASIVHHQELNTDGIITLDIKTSYDPDGYITKSIVSEPNGDITESIYRPYQGNKRTILVSSPDEKYTVDKLWISPAANTASSNSDDILIDTEFDAQGNMIYRKVFTENTIKPQQVINFYYLDQDKEKPSIDANNLEKDTTTAFITTLERDTHGSWTKRKEERSDGSITIHTRQIEYISPSIQP